MRSPWATDFESHHHYNHYSCNAKMNNRNVLSIDSPLIKDEALPPLNLSDFPPT